MFSPLMTQWQRFNNKNNSNNLTMTNNILPAEEFIEQQQQNKEEQRTELQKEMKRDKVYLYSLRKAIAKVLEDYEKTAQTLDQVTKQVDGMESTTHATNVSNLQEKLLNELKIEGTINPPWEKAGYSTKEKWIEDTQP